MEITRGKSINKSIRIARRERTKQVNSNKKRSSLVWQLFSSAFPLFDVLHSPRSPVMNDLIMWIKQNWSIIIPSHIHTYVCGVQHGDGNEQQRQTTIMQKMRRKRGEQQRERSLCRLFILIWVPFANVCALLPIPPPCGRRESIRSRKEGEWSAREWHATCGVWIINYNFSCSSSALALSLSGAAHSKCSSLTCELSKHSETVSPV